MSIAKITMLGLETALNYRNESIFDNLNLPEGIDKDNVCDNIILEGGEFEVLYADPDFFKVAVGVWSRKHFRTFDKWIKALNIEYAPLENYDRFESWDDTGSETSNLAKQGTTTDNATGTINNTGTEYDNEHLQGSNNITGSSSNSTEGNTENKVSAFDSSSYQPESSVDTENTSSSTTTENSTNSNDRTLTHNKTDDTTTNNTSHGTSSDTEDYTKGTTGKHTGRIHGNIGVTTSQQMLQSELDIARFNIVQKITDLFLQEFCLLIYS